MTLFAVFKDGVYRQECGGVFSSLELAKAAADRLKAGERDSYHHYEVVPFELDEVTPQTPVTDPGKYYGGGELVERPAVYRV